MRPGVKDHAVDAEVIRGFEISGERAFGTLAQGRIVSRQIDQVDGVKVKGRMAMLCGGLFERRDASLVQLR